MAAYDFTEAQLEEYTILAPTTNSIRSDIQAILNAWRNSTHAVLVTKAGFTIDSPVFISLETMMLQLGEQMSKEVNGRV